MAEELEAGTPPNQEQAECEVMERSNDLSFDTSVKEAKSKMEVAKEMLAIRKHRRSQIVGLTRQGFLLRVPVKYQTEDDEMVLIKELKQRYISEVFDLKEIPYSIKE